MQKELRQVEKILGKKWIANLGIDIDKLKQNIAKMTTLLTAVQTALDTSRYEDAQEALQEINEWARPGDIRASFDQLREITDRMRNVPKGLRAVVEENLNDLIESIRSSVDEGDYREANQAFNELRNRLGSFWDRLNQMRGGEDEFDKKYRATFDKLEKAIDEKLEGKGQNEVLPSKPSEKIPSLEPTTKQRPPAEPSAAIPEKAE